MNVKLIKNIKHLDKIIDITILTCQVILQLNNHNSYVKSISKFVLINKIISFLGK
jgi:hypothetical protein